MIFVVSLLNSSAAGRKSIYPICRGPHSGGDRNACFQRVMRSKGLRLILLIWACVLDSPIPQPSPLKVVPCIQRKSPRKAGFEGVIKRRRAQQVQSQWQGIRWADGFTCTRSARWPLGLQTDYRRAGARLRSRSSSGQAVRIAVVFIQFSLLVRV